jgi:hypothetical protein
VQAYKNIHVFLESIPEDTKVLISGVCDIGYKKILIAISSRRQLDVLFDDRFIGDDELNALISLARVVVITTSSETCIMSGGIIHALNLQAKIMLTDPRFLLELPDDLKPYIINSLQMEDENLFYKDKSTQVRAFYENFSLANVSCSLEAALRIIK